MVMVINAAAISTAQASRRRLRITLITCGGGGKPAGARGTKLAMAGPPAEMAEGGENAAEPLTADAESAVAEPMAHGFKLVEFAWGQILCRGGKNHKPLPITILKS